MKLIDFWAITPTPTMVVLQHLNSPTKLWHFPSYLEWLWFGRLQASKDCFDWGRFDLIHQIIEFWHSLFPVFQFGARSDVIRLLPHLLTLGQHLEKRNLYWLEFGLDFQKLEERNCYQSGLYLFYLFDPHGHTFLYFLHDFRILRRCDKVSCNGTKRFFFNCLYQ